MEVGHTEKEGRQVAIDADLQTVLFDFEVPKFAFTASGNLQMKGMLVPIMHGQLYVFFGEKSQKKIPVFRFRYGFGFHFNENKN